MNFTDIRTDTWIKHLPSQWQSFAYLARLDRPVGIALLLLPGWWAIILSSSHIDFFTLKILTLFLLGAIVMRAAGCVINDLWDKDIDRRVMRTQSRPIASGIISPMQALIFLSVLLLTGFIILLQMNITTLIWGILSLPLIALYPLMKRITWWPQAFLGLTFNFGALMGWSAISGNISWAAFFLYLSGIAWTLGYDTIYAHQDKDDDALVGIKSSALKLGERSKIWVARFYGASLLFCAVSFVLAGASAYSAIFVIPLALHLVWQVKNWDTASPESSLMIFKSNILYGTLVFFAAIASKI